MSMEGEEEDRLSALPALPLLHILSFLSLNDVVKTIVLSRRWQFLWTDLPQLDFRDRSQEIVEIRSFIERVSKTLVMSNGTDLKKFGVSFNYHDCFASSVNLWFQFLIKNKVNDVSLHLLWSNCYELPLLMYLNSSLTNLSLMRCTIAPPKNMRWKSLTRLSIARANLSPSVMEIILSGCPVLGFLRLADCRGLRLLRLNTRSVRRLVLENWYGGDNLVKICAPYIHDLSITGSYSMAGIMCRAFRLIDISSLVVANLGLNRYVPLSRRNEARSRKFMNYMKELFESLRHVEELQFGTWFFEVLKTLKLGDSNLPEYSWLQVGPWKLPQYSCKSLTLLTIYQPATVYGILCMLESSPNLETLVINGSHAPLQKAGVALDPVESHLTKSDLNCGLLHLKTVKIVIPHSEVLYLGNKAMLTLVQLLLKRASVLEKMVVNVEESSGVSSMRNPSEYVKLAQMLLSYPRSSPIAKVVLS